MFPVTIKTTKKEENQIRKIPQKDIFLNEAKNGLNEYIKDYATNPNDFEVSDLKVVYSTDSACVIKFRFVAENKIGGHVNGKAQWIWLKYNDEIYQSWQDSEDKDIYEFGEGWIIEDNFIRSLSIINLCMEVADKDSFVYKTIYKDDTMSFGDDYMKLYCIVKTKGMKVKKREQYNFNANNWR